jgi:alpha-tubulin suppressor-like RCC1 family protein
MQRARLWLLPTLFIAALASQTACNDNQPPADDQATVTLRISAADVETSGASRSRVSSMAVRGPTPFASANFSYTDITRMQVTIKQGSTTLFANLPFLPDPDQPGGWVAEVPLLPKNVQLTFLTEAFKDADLIFDGQVDQTLTGNNQIVIVRLGPVTDGNEIKLPRIRRIYLPTEFYAEQGDNVTFSMESTLGDQLRFEITPAANGGQFVPPTGSLTLLSTLGSFVSQYIPPLVSVETSFTHTVKVTNRSGYSIATAFTTLVKPPRSNDGARNTDITVLYNPVITGLTGQRIGSEVRWTATVSDETPANITYAWSFVPHEGTPTPAPAFVDPLVNPAVLQNYTVDAAGILTLEIMEGTNTATRTTLTYDLTPNQFPDAIMAPTPTTGLVSVVAGDNHTCALRDITGNNALRCWGYGDAGRLGYSNENNVGAANTPLSVGDVPEVSDIKQVAGGGGHTCVLLNSGFVKCWGANTYGQLGYGHTSDIGDGEFVGGAGSVLLGGVAIKVAAGGQHSCALMDTGSVRCWGRNNFGQLGYANTSLEPAIGDDERPYEAGDVNLNGDLAQDITAGANHTCALLRNGRVRCWGDNSQGQLGYGNTTRIGEDEHPGSVASVDVAGPVIRLRARGNDTCALLANGFVRCWGNNAFGQNGLGDTSAYRTAPANDVNLGETATDIAVGVEHACALLAGGGVKCWGRGTEGQLGNGTWVTVNAPLSSPISMPSAVRITAGARHSCALLSTGKVRCWGTSANGELGYASTSSVNLPTQDVQVLDP